MKRVRQEAMTRDGHLILAVLAFVLAFATIASILPLIHPGVAVLVVLVAVDASVFGFNLAAWRSS